jgi:hypothetical protein
MNQYQLLVTGYWFTFAFGSGELARLTPVSVLVTACWLVVGG